VISKAASLKKIGSYDVLSVARGSVGLASLGFAPPLLGACGDTETFRYRMTVEVDMPQWMKSSPIVIEVGLSNLGSFGLRYEDNV